MQTDVYIKIINEKMNIKFLVCWILVIPAIIAFGFRQRLKLGVIWFILFSYNFWQQLLSIWELNLFQKISWSPLLFDINDSFLILSLQSFLFFFSLFKKDKKISFLYFCSFRTFSFNQDLIQDEIILSYECHSMLLVCKGNVFFWDFVFTNNVCTQFIWCLILKLHAII